jgi:hypothetical protein
MTKHISTNGSEANGSSLELKNFRETGRELAKIVSNICENLARLDGEKIIYTLQELIEAVYMSDALVVCTKKGAVAFPIVGDVGYLMDCQTVYREILLEAITNSKYYNDNNILVSEEIEKLKTIDFEMFYVYPTVCDFSFEAFSEAIEESKILLENGYCNNSTTSLPFIYEMMDDFFEDALLEVPETEAGRKYLVDFQKRNRL